MSDAQHTPGPWTVEIDATERRLRAEAGLSTPPDQFDVLAGRPDDRVVVATTNGYRFVSEQVRGCGGDPRKNAALIAAAPDLLAQAEFLLEVARLQPAPTLGGWDWPGIADRLGAVVRKAKAVGPADGGPK